MRRIKDIAQPVEKPGKTARANAAASPIREPQASDVCPICKGRGFLAFDAPPGHPDFSKALPCRCTQAKLTAERTRALRDLSNLGALSRMTFDSFMPDGVGLPQDVRFNLRQAYELSLSFAREPKGWLVLLGGYGCGKTHLAAAIANQCIALGHTALFVIVPDLLDHLRAAYAPYSETTFDERLEAVRDAPLLILDDLGAHSSTPWAQEKLYQILNHRYNGRLPTVITSNQHLEELDPRITSRLVDPDLSQVYEILAPDFRQPGAERSVALLGTLAFHKEQTLESFSPRSAELPSAERENLRRAIALARTFAENPSGWLVFTGAYGCGKTHLAAAIANYQVTLGRPAPVFVVAPDLLDHLRATFSPTSATTLDKLFEQVKSAALLIIDDLGTESATPWAREKLFQLLNHRYAARLPTVITTSDSIEQVDPRLRTRMLDHSRCTVFAIQAPSYRGGEEQRAAKSAGGKGRSRSAKTADHGSERGGRNLFEDHS
ncbi:MAG: AAA family ATPase [Chloroflexi bacterium]|nr:AAA family ATPase [Chloroflexota bacterium]